MDYAQIKNDLAIHLGTLGPGNLAYSTAQIAKAIQWAQEQTARVAGLTYTEPSIPTKDVTGPWGEAMKGVDIPLDAIKVVRCEISDVPPAKFSITVSPAFSRVQFDDEGDQIGPLVLDVRITRASDYNETIDVSCDAFTSTDNFDGTADNQPFSVMTDHLAIQVDDVWVIRFMTTLTGFNEVASNWLNQRLKGVGADGAIVYSNEFTVVDPIPDQPYIKVNVDPVNNYLDPSSPPTPMVFTATITRVNGYGQTISGTIPRVLGTVNPDAGTGPDYEINIQMDSTSAIPGTPSVTEADIPDSFPITITVGSNSVGPWTLTNMQLVVTGEDGVAYFSNNFSVRQGD